MNQEERMECERVHGEQLRKAVLAFDNAEAKRLATEVVRAGVDPRNLIDAVVMPLAKEIGRKFENDEFFLPQLILAGQALDEAMNVLLAAVPPGLRPIRTVVVIGTVKNDIHSIGKNIIAMALRTAGYDVRDLGIDIPTATFIRAAVEHNATIIAVSSLLTTTMPYQRELIEELKRQNLRDRFRVLVGGGPTNKRWAEEIGADGHGADAVEAVVEARRLSESAPSTAHVPTASAAQGA